MREVFKGWRRKVGCVTLAMALVFMGMWMRSRVRIDSFYLNGSTSLYSLCSIDSRLLLARCRPSTSGPFIDWSTSKSAVGFTWDPDLYYVTEWRTKWAGFEVGVFNPRGNQTTRMELCLIPYWSLVIPLTLLSAYLILWKPRQRTEPDHA